MKGRFGKILLILVFLALVANLVVVVITNTSPVGEMAVRYIVFGSLVIANLIFAFAGITFVTKSHQMRERTSLVWARRGFIVYGLSTIILGLAPWLFYIYDSVPIEDRLFDVSLLLLLFGFTNGIFTLAFYREYLRGTGSRSSNAKASRRRRRSDPPPTEE